TAVRYFLIENYLTAVFLGIYVPLPLFSTSLENLLTFTLFKRQQRLLKFGRHYMVLKNLHEN
ncbi:hypothetical protein ACQJ1K_12565, partial [Staphylococcus aureus]